MTFRLNLDELSTLSPEDQSQKIRRSVPYVNTPGASIHTISGLMTFTEACERIKNRPPEYRVILRYRNDIKWAFKFEKGVKQLDAIELLYLLTEGEEKFKLYHLFESRWNKLKMSTRNKTILHNLAHGQGFGNYHDTYRQCFTAITGIDASASKAYDCPRFPDTCEDSDVRAICSVCPH